jgi:anti-sigma regulatory factor (Ser/Thr protein kinase)
MSAAGSFGIVNDVELEALTGGWLAMARATTLAELEVATASDAAFASELIVGELLANTVEHAPGHVELSLDWTGEAPALSVRDRGPGMTSVRASLPLGSVIPVDGGGTELRVVLPLQRRVAP